MEEEEKYEVPSKIIEHLSSEDLVVRENDEVTLVCNVTGVPAPEVTWYRHAQSRAGVEKHSEFCAGTDQVGVKGEVLIIHNVTRYCGDTYECVAFNGVPPPVSHFVQVDVEFGPEIHLPNRRIGQDVGRETILECTVTAFPHAVTMWERNGEKVSTLSQKYRLEIYDEDHNTITLSLRIFSIEPHDYGTYTCVASNPLGQDAESMVLYEYSAHILTMPPTTMMIPTTTAIMRRRSTTQMILLRPNHVDRGSGKANRDQLPPHPDHLYPPMSFPEHWSPRKSQQGGSREDEAPPSVADNRNAARAIDVSACSHMMIIVCMAVLKGPVSCISLEDHKCRQASLQNTGDCPQTEKEQELEGNPSYVHFIPPLPLLTRRQPKTGRPPVRRSSQQQQDRAIPVTAQHRELQTPFSPPTRTLHHPHCIHSQQQQDIDSSHGATPGAADTIQPTDPHTASPTLHSQENLHSSFSYAESDNLFISP
ncbi:hypothetical protein ACOMHN_032759 [Nucella lapillus]